MTSASRPLGPVSVPFALTALASRGKPAHHALTGWVTAIYYSASVWAEVRLL